MTALRKVIPLGDVQTSTTSGLRVISLFKTYAAQSAAEYQVPIVLHEAQTADAEAWNKIIHDTLVSWERSTRALEDDGVSPPSGLAIQIAVSIASDMRNRGERPPTSVVPNGDGGIVFELRRKADRSTIEVLDDGAVYVARFHDARLIDRHLVRQR